MNHEQSKAESAGGGTITRLQELPQYKQKMRQFLANVPNERIFRRCVSGSREELLSRYSEPCGQRNLLDVFVAVVDGEIQAVFDGSTTTKGDPRNRGYEVGLLSISGNHGKALIEHARKKRPHFMFVGSPVRMFDVPLHVCMMRTLDVVLPYAAKDTRDSLRLLGVESIATFPLWVRHPPKDTHPLALPPLNGSLVNRPLRDHHLRAARHMAQCSMFCYAGMDRFTAAMKSMEVLQREVAISELMCGGDMSLKSAMGAV